jgi:hypothetical protein
MTDGNQTGAGDGGQNSAGDGAADSLSETQLAQVAEVVNRAISKRTRGLDEKLTTQVAAQLSQFQEAVTASVGELLEPIQQRSGDGGEAKGDGEAIKEHPEFKGLQKQLNQVQKALEQSQAEAKAKDEMARGATLRQTLAEGLAAHKIEGVNASHAVGHLIDAAKRVRHDGDQVVFVEEDGDVVDLKTGLADWVKTSDAKLYQSPTGASGSGTRPKGGGSGPSGGNNDSSSTSLGERLVAAFQDSALE